MHMRFDARRAQSGSVFPWWQDFVHEVFGGLQAHRQVHAGQDDRGFSVALELEATPGIRLARIGGSAHSVRRIGPAAQLNDEVGVLLQAFGHSQLDLDGQRVCLAPGEIALFDNARPYTFHLDQSFEHHLLLIERSRLGPDAASISARCGERLPSVLPTRLMGCALQEVVGDLQSATAGPMDALAAPLLGWLALSCAPSEPSGARAAKALLSRILADTRSRIEDPALSPLQLAEAHAISERYLHKLFAMHGLTVMSWVREERLQRIDRALRTRGPSLRVEETARRYGFEDMASFRRAYRRRFGCSARETAARL